MRPCPECGSQEASSNSPARVIEQPCPGHRTALPGLPGTGQAGQREHATIRIPAGIPEQTTLRLADHGMRPAGQRAMRM
jgi:hypothetical protein